MKVRTGSIIEGFALLPSINVNWIRIDNKKYFDIQFAWLFWFVTVGQIYNMLNRFK